MWAGIIIFVVLALEGVIPENFLNKIFEAVGILFTDTFGVIGSWKYYLTVIVIWLTAVGTLLGLSLIVIEFVWKIVLWITEKLRKEGR